MRRQPLDPQQQLLDLRREQVHAAHDDHVVAAAGDLLDPAHRAGRARQQPGQIPGPVAHDRHRLLGQAGEDQLAVVPVGQHLPGLGIDDLGVEVVLPDVQAVLGLDALAGDPRTDHLGQAVDVDRVQAGPLLNLGAQVLGPRLGAEDADLQRAVARVQALPLELVEQSEHVGRRHQDRVRLEVGDELHLTLGHAARDGDDRAPEPLGAVVRSEAAGEQSVAVGDVDPPARAYARGAQGSRDDVGPHGDVVLGVADHRRPPRRAAAGVQAAHLFLGHREHAVRVVLAQVGLGRHREVPEVGQRPAVPGCHPGNVERAPVVRHVLVRVLKAPPQPIQLQRGQDLAVGQLDRVEVGRVRREVGQLPHAVGPGTVRLRPRNSATGSSPRRTVTS